MTATETELARREETFDRIRRGESLAGIPAETLRAARLYTGGWSEAKRAIDAELARPARELAAELLVLEVYNARRIAAGHDFGNGQRHSELNRRRRALVALDPGRELLDGVATGTPIFTPDELAAAWRSVGRPRYLRALRERDLYGSPGVILTAQTWETMRLLYGSAV